MMTITSLSNPKVKELSILRKASVRRERGLFLIDGAREIVLAQKAGVGIVELYYCPDLINKWPKDQSFGLNSKKMIEVSEKVFQKVCYKEKPDGFLALAKTKQLELKDIKLTRQPLIIILEGVEKPGNLGAILRTSYAAQVDVIIINDYQTDIYNPNVIRASEGCLFLTRLFWLRLNKLFNG